MHRIISFMLTAALGVAGLAGCADDKPSASEWAAAEVKICTRLEADRKKAAKVLPADAAPTVKQIQEFFGSFGAKFAAAVEEMKSVDRPEGMDSEIDKLEAAMDATVSSFDRISKDRSAAEAELASDGQSKVTKRLEAASSAAGLDACNA